MTFMRLESKALWESRVNTEKKLVMSRRCFNKECAPSKSFLES